MEQTNYTLPASGGQKDRNPKTLSKDPNRAMQEMMAVIDSMRQALIEETAALNEADTQKFLQLQDKKLDIAHDYLDGMTQLISRKEDIKKADPTLIQRLEQTRSDFSETTMDNRAAIDRMSRGMKRLRDRIMEKAREAAKREEELTYSANGRMYAGLRATVGVNETA